MLTKWFKTRTLRAVNEDRSFRPWLEILEDRNAPSGLGPMDPHGPHGHQGPHGPPPPAPVGPPAPAPVSNNNNITSGVNAHGSFNNSTITDSFNNTITNTFILMPTQQSAIGGLLGIGTLVSSMNSQLGSLIRDEIALAVDTYLESFPAVAAALPSLKTDISTLNAAIAANSLESTAFGAEAGTLVFDVTMNALTSAQPTI